MEQAYKVETRVLRNAAGRMIRLDYCLLARSEGTGRQLSGPYGLEIILTGRNSVTREQCRNLTGDYHRAIALVHMFARNSVLPRRMLDDLHA